MSAAPLADAVRPRHVPPLDPGFLPAALWMRAYRKHASEASDSRPLTFALTRPDGTVLHWSERVLPMSGPANEQTLRFAERLLKFLLWSRGGSTVHVAGESALVQALQKIYDHNGARSFDADFLGRRIYLEPFRILACPEEELPAEHLAEVTGGGYLDGCRIGFDLGGSDRKAAALRDGEVVFSEEIEWNPYFEADPSYHLDGIRDSIRRAAAHLPRVDAIGGSAAGVYVNSEPRVGSLFRGVPEDRFAEDVRPIFERVAEEWGAPLSVANDGDVTALAAARMLGENRAGGVLGLALGTSLAAGYVSPEGRLQPWLNELAFVPVEARSADEGAYIDEWSGDAGTGVRYLSQQALGQLAPAAGFDFARDCPLPQQLREVQNAMAENDPRAIAIYESYGCYLGYALAHFADAYDFRHVLVLGRVASGDGGQIMIDQAQRVLSDEFPELASGLDFITPDETFKRHGQAIAAASLPQI